MINILPKIFLILFLYNLSCSHMKSGKFIYLEGPSTLKRITKKYGISVDDLKYHNPERSLASGEWIFVPTKVGTKYFFNETREVSEYSLLDQERFLWPVPNYYRISSRFGKRGHKHHDGIDIPAPIGSRVVASESGKVIYSGNGIKGYGNMVVIAHHGDIFTVYAHNKVNKVKKGQKVKKGDRIAQIGNTGRSTGPHLHFEIRIKNSVANPIGYLFRAAR